MDDHVRALKHFGPLPTLPTLEEVQARLTAGLPPNFARFTADLLAHPDLNELVVGRGISVQGVVHYAERLVVKGTLEATMIHASELSIAPGGVFRGEVEVEDAEVAGTIDGTLTARSNLVVRATGKVFGTVRCRRLQIENGAAITGRIEMLVEGQDMMARAGTARVEMLVEPVA